MTVAQLIEQLQELDPEMEVFLQKDSEGNGFETCRGADGHCVFYYDENSGEFEIYDDDWTAEDAGFDDEKSWEEFKSKRENRCVVLFP